MLRLTQSVFCLLATGALLLGACSDDNRVECANGMLCPEGWGCAVNQDVCIADSCGDGAVDAMAGELCDDGNIRDGDGCSATCEIEAFCGDGNVDPGEDCDDGNNSNGDGCNAACGEEVLVCGNGIVEADEECDDGNIQDGDGCSELCTYEPGFCPEPSTRPAYTYVVDGMLIPNTPAEAITLALDIDGSEPFRNDNALGQVLAALAQQTGLDYNALQQTALNRGDIITLLSLQTLALDNTLCSTLGVHLGDNPSVPPCAGPGDTICGQHLDGTSSFDVAAESPPDSTMDGHIIANSFSMSPLDPPGSVTIELQFNALGQPSAVDLIGARADLNPVAADGVQSGILGGGIIESDVQAEVLPAIHAQIEEQVAADCTGGMPCCAPGSSGQTMVDLFDEDMDCQVSITEFRDDALIGALFSPDLDLLDGNGDFAPNVDGVPDSLSIGLGITAVGGQFTIP